LRVSLASFAAITLSVASQRVFVVVYFIIDTVRKLLVTHSYSTNKGSACIDLLQSTFIKGDYKVRQG